MNADTLTGPLATGGFASVLVAEDDATARLLVREALEQSGFRVEEAADGAAAVEVFPQVQPDIVLVDVMMPRMDGFETCERLRADPIGRHVPIVMMTGLDDIESIKRAYEAGATDFITKPFPYEVLTQRVRYMVRAKRTADELRRTANELRESEARLQQAHRLARLGHWEWDVVRQRLHTSKEYRAIFGFAGGATTMDGDDMLDLVHAEDRRSVRDAVDAAVADGTPYKIEFRITRPDGSERIVLQEAEAIAGNDGESVRIIGTAQDITERRAAEEQVRYLAYYDNVTGLPNRSFLREQLRDALNNARHQDEMVGVLFLDLDGFKLVNDTLGHSVGDMLLQGVASRLGECVRDGDRVTRLDSEDFESDEPWLDPNLVARLGGDEFVIVLTEIGKRDEAAAVALRIASSLARPFALEGEKVYVSTSVGISLYPQDGTDEDTLLKHADAAMYEAKARGPGGHQFYAADIGGQADSRLALETELREALDKGQFVLHYQPKIGLAERDIQGMEALLRWRHPKNGLMDAEAFVSVAEESGLMPNIGGWVFREACDQHRRWVAEGLSPVPICINVSPRQFDDPALLAGLSAAINGAGIDARLLQIELTENALMSNPAQCQEKLEALKDMGMSVAVDDFGTGYFSLAQLKELPLDVIKVDGSFISEIATDEHSRAIIQATIGLAHNLGLTVVAEGVETKEQLECLRNFGCDQAQGLAVSEPLPPNQMNSYLEQRAINAALRG